MRKRHVLSGLLALSLLALTLLAGACSQESDVPSQTSSAVGETGTTAAPGDETTEETPETRKDIVPVYHKKLYRTCLDWNNASESDTDGVVSWWKNSSCVKLEANLISVFPYYRETTGKFTGGATMLPDCYPTVIEYTKAGLQKAHSLGIEVVPSLPMVLLNKEVYTAKGYDWKPLAQQNLRGLYSEDTKFGYACINNPEFQSRVRAYTVDACKAGFDGMFFDGSPYSYGLMLNCCCPYCQETWKEYSLKYLGKETEIPSTAPTHTTKASRVLWKMRCDIFNNFVLDMWEECKAINPNFNVWPNLGINGTIECYYTTHGLTTTITEYGSNSTVNPGYDSTLYMFRQYEAENPEGMLISQFNSIPDQATPLFKWKTAYVEAFAAGGSLMMPVSTTGTEKLFPEISKANAIIDANTEAFTDSASAAPVAIVYSWQEMNYCHLKSTGLLSFEKNAPRRLAAAFAARGIPFDYLMPEKTTDLSQLSRYSAIAFADFNLMSDGFAVLLREYVENGGQLLVLGKNFASYVSILEGIDYDKRTPDLLKQWTDLRFDDVIDKGEIPFGSGKIVIVKDWVSGTSEASAVYTEDFCQALETLRLYDAVRVEEDITGNVETTLRRNADGSKYWLHLITYNSNEVYDDKPVTVTMTLPEGETVKAVRADSVTLTSEQNKLTWSQTGNQLQISAVIGLWTMITVEK